MVVPVGDGGQHLDTSVESAQFGPARVRSLRRIATLRAVRWSTSHVVCRHLPWTLLVVSFVMVGVAAVLRNDMGSDTKLVALLCCVACLVARVAVTTS